MNIENLRITSALMGGKINITIQVDEAHKNYLSEIAEMFRNGKLIDCKIEPLSKKKTLSANAYLWKLCFEIANKIGSTKEEVYREAIREKGVFEQREITDIEAFNRKWAELGTGFFTEMVSPGIYNSYYGSSVYDRKELSQIIDYVVEEAKILGIETMTADEQIKLMEMWKK